MFEKEIVVKLIGGFNPSEKYESIGLIMFNIWKTKTCSKPPTSYYDELLEERFLLVLEVFILFDLYQSIGPPPNR